MQLAQNQNQGPLFNDILIRKSGSDNTRVKSMIIEYSESYLSTGSRYD